MEHSVELESQTNEIVRNLRSIQEPQLTVTLEN